MASSLLRRSTPRHTSVTHFLSPFIPRLHYSSSSSASDRFTSIHGERPSSAYAKKRQESLESEFGEILGARSKSLFAYTRVGPFLALYRAAVVSFEVTKLTFWHFVLKDVHKRAQKFRETLIRLGPFYIKLGQALSTRPDILPSAYCKELSKLQDQIPPFSTRIAMKSIENQLGAPVSEIFTDISPQPIAAASLGQVYKAHLRSGELVAVKVQRPGMTPSLTLDALLFQMIGGQLKRFAKARKDLLVAVNEMVRHMFNEIDYILEAQNADRFAALYSNGSVENNWRQEPIIKVPKIYWKYTRKAVLTMEWLDGIKLTDSEKIHKANLNRKALIDQGVYCSLRQLLEEGFFHADPHPGNLVVTKEGLLAYFDFGMMGDIPRHYRVGLIQILVHYVNRDSLGLANDFHSLGFVPEGTDLRQVADALRNSFGDSGTRQSNDFQGIMSQLYDVMYEFNFSLPPDYALVIRALGSLEGTAKALDPGFKVIESAYPFIIGRLLADPNTDMRRILRELLFRNDGSIRWNRLERLIAAISEQTSEQESTAETQSSTTETKNSYDSKSGTETKSSYDLKSGTETKNSYNSKSGTETKTRVDSKSGTTNHGWKSFDMRSVVASTEDLFNFILSEKGRRVRVFLIQDILKASDAFLQDLASPCFFDKNETLEKDPNPESAMINRVINGIKSLREAVRLAPEIWMAMLIRIMIKPEMNGFLFHVFRALERHSRFRIPDTFWLCFSRFLHHLEKEKQHGI